jgi:hypothetical protein
MLLDRADVLKRFIDLLSEPGTSHEDIHYALTLSPALASGISMIALAFRFDFRQLAADNSGYRTAWELPLPKSE